jgi:serine/threonine protein kinase
VTTSRPQDAPDASAIRHGTKVGKFVVVAELGSGGMGVVYAAHDRELDRQVALKVMRGAGEEADEDRVRMLREGQAMARVVHPNVITVFEVGTEGGLVFLAQELLDGGTLGQWLEKPRSHPEIVDKFVASGRGLAAAHAAGLVHRDFKPDNVLLGKDGRASTSGSPARRCVRGIRR